MTQDLDWLDKLDRLALGWLWRPDRPAGGPGRAALLALQVVYLSVRNFFGRRLAFQASALTFITLLGLVPALAISFSLAKGLGFADAMRAALFNEFTASQHQVMEYILQYVERTNMGALGVMGLAALIVSLVLALSNAEDAFNRIWEVKETRSLFRKFTDYLSVLIICPLLIVAGTGIWAGMAAHGFVQWLMGQALIGEVAAMGLQLGPVLMLAVAFVFMYMFLPNTRVPFVSAVIAGVVTAGLWWGVQHAYLQFQIGVARYNAIYGGFATLPLFLVWLQVSWTVVLYGAELAHADYLCRNDMLPRALLPPLSPARHQTLGLDLMMIVAHRFHQGLKPLPLVRLAALLGVAPDQAAAAAQRLSQAGLISPPDQEGLIMPLRDLSNISALELVQAVGAGPRQGASACLNDQAMARLLGQMENAQAEALGRVSLLELVRRNQPPLTDTDATKTS